ncbi:hypothetical protein VSDG_03995 [Cytospora chrysosperma]|uniref:Zn(2)-C6 fungal-type domain-containing protein n=1 Tax=Cytospora chrysosperma TaxID=252740 RepID=A0A423W7N1_CYTCH|nr:hypothetical protein VSDG_03995 [Valsa sordida]
MSLFLLPREQDATTPRAAQACKTCRKQKRRCDKALPACSRCASLQRPCDYSEPPAEAPAAPTAEAFASLQVKLAEIEAKLDANRTPSAVADVVLPTPGFSPGDVPMGNANPDGGDLYMGGQEGQPLCRNRFPSMFFLDLDVYKGVGVRIPKPSVEIPMTVLEILASTNVIEDTTTTYFDTIHRWYPFISRKRMNLGISLQDGGPDLALLFLTMKLITTPPGTDMTSSTLSPSFSATAADTHLYTTSKQFLALLESAGTASILYLQAMILVALYEYAHGIYPAAWMTSGSCVRYASMLGLQSYQESRAVLGPCTTWTEAEERRRVWWAAHVLDRAVSLGTKRPFAGGPDPPPDTDFLPVDDRAWDEGHMARSLQRPVGTPVGERGAFGPFARLAQASVLTSRAMAHCKRATARYARSRGQGTSGGSPGAVGGGVVAAEEPEPEQEQEKPYDIREATAVLSDLRALCEAISGDLADAGGQGGGSAHLALALAPSRCLVWSASVMVLDLYSCPEHMRPGAGSEADESRSEQDLAMQVEAINGLNVAGETIRAFAGDILGLTSTAPGALGDGADKLSPLCLDALYCALATYHWQWKENGQPEMKQGMDETRAALGRLAPRWRLAGEYLKIDRYSGVTIVMGAREDGT